MAERSDRERDEALARKAEDLAQRMREDRDRTWTLEQRSLDEGAAYLRTGRLAEDRDPAALRDDLRDAGERLERIDGYEDAAVVAEDVADQVEERYLAAGPARGEGPELSEGAGLNELAVAESRPLDGPELSGPPARTEDAERPLVPAERAEGQERNELEPQREVREIAPGSGGAIDRDDGPRGGLPQERRATIWSELREFAQLARQATIEDLALRLLTEHDAFAALAPGSSLRFGGERVEAQLRASMEEARIVVRDGSSERDVPIAYDAERAAFAPERPADAFRIEDAQRGTAEAFARAALDAANAMLQESARRQIERVRETLAAVEASRTGFAESMRAAAFIAVEQRREMRTRVGTDEVITKMTEHRAGEDGTEVVFASQVDLPDAIALGTATLRLDDRTGRASLRTTVDKVERMDSGPALDEGKAREIQSTARESLHAAFAEKSGHFMKIAHSAALIQNNATVEAAQGDIKPAKMLAAAVERQYLALGSTAKLSAENRNEQQPERGRSEGR